MIIIEAFIVRIIPPHVSHVDISELEQQKATRHEDIW
jgi:hypothetical protein